MTVDEKIKRIELSDVIRFINWYPENTQPPGSAPLPLVNQTIGLWSDSEHELAELGREFKRKCIEYYKKQQP